MKFTKDHGGRSHYFPTKLKKDLTGDCVVRAIAIATNQDYMYIMKELFRIGLEIGHMPNNPRTYEKYLDSIGWVKNKPFRKSNKKKYQVKNLPIKSGTSYIIHTTSHLTAIVGGVLRDTWNCGAWCANSYYTKEVIK